MTDPSFWSTHTGAEVDLRLALGTRVVGVEVKRTQAPITTKAMYSALKTLELDHLYVVHAGSQRFRLAEAISAVPAAEVLTAATVAEALT